MKSAPQNHSLAVLIDADNASSSIIEGLLAEIAKLGVASVKRVYGDWTNQHLSGWKSVLLDYSLQPVQQFGYTSGKNSTDSAMIIDAMDLLHSGQFTGFCLVSSDSDFTRLASRLRESGKLAYGFGEKKTPRPFVSACDRFTYTEVFRSTPPQHSEKESKTPAKLAKLRGDTKLVRHLRAGVDAASDDNSWAPLGPVGAYINKTLNDFDPRNYGYSKLSLLIDAIGLFEVKRDGKAILVRDKRKR